MKSSKQTYIMRLLQTENEQLRKLHSIVGKAIEEENTLSDKLNDAGTSDNRTLGERMADKVATFGGSWKFIIIFMILLFGWIAYNTLVMHNKTSTPFHTFFLT